MRKILGLTVIAMCSIEGFAFKSDLILLVMARVTSLGFRVSGLE